MGNEESDEHARRSNEHAHRADERLCTSAQSSVRPQVLRKQRATQDAEHSAPARQGAEHKRDPIGATLHAHYFHRHKVTLLNLHSHCLYCFLY